MGGGSYMEFSTRDAAFPLDKMIALMDAVRVGFVDMQGNLLGVGKLNTSNRTILDGTVKASLYLYDYTIEPKGEKDGKLGAMIMGERRKTDNKIMDLTQNTAAALSVVVWLDGDIVDNTMVSATESASLNGMLNLQFATSADLVPAGNAVLLNMEPNKDNLATLLEQNKETFEANQGQYTTASWKEFVSAYTYADSVNESLDSNEFQIYHAMTDLALAQNGLTTVTHDALATQIGAVRELVGINSGVTARYVLEDATGAYYTVDPYTEEQKANKVGEIEEVNPAKNLRDEGHDITSPIYTNESWNALAAALYHAEATHMNANATDQQISSALDALDAAYKALEHRVFFIPYEYNGRIYYTAIRNRDAVLEANDVDTYGTWYYADFTRVVSDLTTLELDAYAEPAEIATIQQSEFVDYRTLLINPYVTIKDDFYPELKDEEFLAIQWNPAPDLFTQGVTASQLAQLSYLCEKGTELGVTSQAADDFATAAKVLNPGVDDPEYLYTESEAATLIRNLAPIVNAAVAAKEQEDADAKAEAEKDNITADQRTVLTAAIASAKTVVGYENAENTDEKLVALRAAVTAAQALLDNAAATKDTADEALTELNKQLVANGKTEVTAYNTITYKIPLTSEEYEVAYGVNHPNTRLLVHGEIGTRELKAIVLTKNGVVFTVSKEITVYHPALDIESYSMVEDAQGKANKATSATLNVGEEAELLYEFELYTATEKDGKYYNQRDILLTETILDASLNHCIPHGETVGATRYSEYRWASSDPKVVSITSDDTSDICTISAVGAGSATISLSVITDQGNMYYDTFSITVTSTTPETP